MEENEQNDKSSDGSKYNRRVSEQMPVLGSHRPSKDEAHYAQQNVMEYLSRLNGNTRFDFAKKNANLFAQVMSSSQSAHKDLDFAAGWECPAGSGLSSLYPLKPLTPCQLLRIESSLTLLVDLFNQALRPTFHAGSGRSLRFEMIDDSCFRHMPTTSTSDEPLA